MPPKNRLRLFLPAVFAALALAQHGHTATAEDAIGQLAESYVRSGEVPGIIIGIWKPDGLTLIKRGVSDLATGAPMELANSQRIGSITKSFTVTRVLQLADEGRLSLDDPISKYVSGLRNGDATLRQLADMTSGIFNYTEDGPFVLDFAFHRTKRWTDRQLVAVANKHEPYFLPGRHWHYSNTNTVLLGMVVERVTGNPLRVELTRHIFRPLGLAHTLYPAGIFLPQPFSHGYATLDTDQGRIDVSEVSPTGFSGAGAIISTLGDTRLWGRSLARGSLLSRRSQLARLQMIDSSRGVGPYYDRYGLALGRINGWLGHTGDLFGYQSLVMHNLVADETVVIFVNASNPDHVPTDLFRAITPLLSRAVPARAPALRITGKRQRATSAGAITFRGRAESEASILLVEYSLNGTPVRLARGTRIWRAQVPLQPGRNIITFRSVDALGRKSKPSKIAVTRS
jgi:CubicO group peptidase (beta-lactamase class C family)